MKRSIMFCDTWNSGLIVHKQKFGWNTAMHIHLYIAYDCFHTMTAQVSSYKRACMAHKAKNIYVIRSKGLGRNFQIRHTQVTTCCPSKPSKPPTAIYFILQSLLLCVKLTQDHISDLPPIGSLILSSNIWLETLAWHNQQSLMGAWN